MRFLTAKVLIFLQKCGILIATDVLQMIERPMYTDRIMAYVNTPFVKILTGVRRCGKSTILKMIIERLKDEYNVPEERILSYRFDSMESKRCDLKADIR